MLNSQVLNSLEIFPSLSPSRFEASVENLIISDKFLPPSLALTLFTDLFPVNFTEHLTSATLDTFALEKQTLES
jgi:hypothetical protein